MDKNSEEYKKLKKEMDDYLKEKEKKKEQQRLNSLGFARGVYPSEEYQNILRKREKAKSGNNSKLSKLLYLLIIILIILVIYSVLTSI